MHSARLWHNCRYSLGSLQFEQFKIKYPAVHCVIAECCHYEYFVTLLNQNHDSMCVIRYAAHLGGQPAPLPSLRAPVALGGA